MANGADPGHGMAFNCREQTGRQRAVRRKEEGWLRLLTDGVTFVTSLLKNRSAVRTSNLSMRPYYLLREFTQVIVFAVYIPPLLTLMQLVMLSTQSQAHCRHSTHRTSSSSLGTSIMHLCPPPCPHSHNMSPATTGTIKHWTYVMPTWRRHTTHPPSLPWEDLTTTWCISRLFTSPLLTVNQWKPASLRQDWGVWGGSEGLLWLNCVGRTVCFSWGGHLQFSRPHSGLYKLLCG